MQGALLTQELTGYLASHCRPNECGTAVCRACLFCTCQRRGQEVRRTTVMASGLKVVDLIHSRRLIPCKQVGDATRSSLPAAHWAGTQSKPISWAHSGSVNHRPAPQKPAQEKSSETSSFLFSLKAFEWGRSARSPRGCRMLMSPVSLAGKKASSRTHQTHKA